MIASTCSEVNVIIVPLEAAIIQFYLDAVQQFLLDFLVCFFFFKHSTTLSFTTVSRMLSL